MKSVKNRGIACVLLALFVLAGVFMVKTPSSKTVAADTAAIDEKIVSIKCAIRKAENDNYLRVVTTIDDAKSYQSLGFEITFLGNGADEQDITKEHRIKKVFRKINSKFDGVDYDFSPKVFDTKSQWFATCTVTGIPDAYLDNYIVIKPYVTMIGQPAEKVYGQSRYITMQDVEKGIVSLPIKGELTDPSIDGKDPADGNGYYDGIYTHVRVIQPYDKNLASVTSYTVKDGATEYQAKYRYLYSQVENDTSWYMESDKDDKVIVTAGDMRGFSELSKDNNFANETIWLGADIELNSGWVASTKTAAPKEWTPIGRYGSSSSEGDKEKYARKPFAGIFDGDMHSISGIYMNNNTPIKGLFGETSGAKIQNFVLKNSYIKTGGRYYNVYYVGSAVGKLSGELNNVKGDTTVYIDSSAAGIGGLAGGATNGTINNCWFAGSITKNGSKDTQYTEHGGLLGILFNGSDTCTINDSLVTGKIEKTTSASGGIFGGSRNSAVITINNSLYAGDMSDTSISTYVEDISGGVSGSNVKVSNVYTTVQKTSKTGVNKIDGATQLLGDAAYCNINFTFDIPEVEEVGDWVALENHAPVQKCFAGTVTNKAVNLTKAQGTRTLWYDGSGNYTLYSPADLRGFSELSATTDFVNETIALGADIDLKPGWKAQNVGYADLVDYPVDERWNPIGSRAKNGAWVGKAFAGTFDGNMHSVSGVCVAYPKEDNTHTLGLFGLTNGATIQNFVLKNSYISAYRGDQTGAYIGGIVGTLNGTLSNVKCDSDVIIKLNGILKWGGGLAGKVTTGEIKNCWFAGQIKGLASKPGFYNLGGLIGGLEDKSSTCVIKDSVVTGNIDNHAVVGGICGRVASGTTLNVSNTISAGGYAYASDSNKGSRGNVVGRVETGGTLNAENLYARADGFANPVGIIDGETEPGADINSAVTKFDKTTEMVGEKAYINMNLDYYIPGVHESGIWVIPVGGVPTLKVFADAMGTDTIDITKI